MNTEFEMQLDAESGGRFRIKVKKQMIEFIFEDGDNQAKNFLSRSELKDLAKICHFAWENSAALMRTSKEDPTDE